MSAGTIILQVLLDTPVSQCLKFEPWSALPVNPQGRAPMPPDPRGQRLALAVRTLQQAFGPLDE